ncbi:MAG TPA: DNA-binding domain-containing protein [Azospirillaceae bacterium]|nr:DNA-binding domain-containing protein [Azospirillaceae bacterium]
MRLADLQAAFRAHLLDGDAAIAGAVLDGPAADRATLLGVYRHAYRARLVEVLEKDFPATLALVGEAEFAALAVRYVAAHPSRSFTVRWLGRHLPDFLADALPGGPAAEMAAFEWALGEAFDAADAEPLGIAEVAAVPPERWPGLRLRFVPSLRRLDLSWTVPQAWGAVTGDGPEAERVPVPWPEGRLGWLVWRAGLDPMYRSLDAQEAAALDLMAAGGSFGDLCARLLEEVGDQAPIAAAAHMREWVESGLVAGLEVGPEVGLEMG